MVLQPLLPLLSSSALHASFSPRHSRSGQLVFVDRLRRGENCLRIGCISLGFRGSRTPSSAPFFFSSSLSPREEGSQRGRYKSDTPMPIQPTVFLHHLLLVLFAGYFFKLKILLFFSWMDASCESFFLETFDFKVFLLFKSKQNPNSFRWQRLIQRGVFFKSSNRSSFKL